MKHNLLLALTCLLCTSCYHAYYSPNTAHVPLLSQKGEGKLTASIGTGANTEYTSGELQLAFAATKNLGFMVNGFTATKSEETEDNHEKGSGSYIEAAPGLFMPISRNGKWRAELYAGAGTGSVTNNYGVPSSSKVGVTKAFLQPAIGYKSTNLEVAFAPKMSFINWKVKEDRVLADRDSYDKTEVDYISQQTRFTAFEPSLIIRAGGENVKVQLGITYSFTNIKEYELTEELLLSVGIAFGFGQKKK